MKGEVAFEKDLEVQEEFPKQGKVAKSIIILLGKCLAEPPRAYRSWSLGASSSVCVCEVSTYIHYKAGTQMFRVALFIIAKRRFCPDVQQE